MNDTLWGAILGTMGTAIVAVGGVVIKLWKARAEINKVTRKDLIVEHEQFSKRLQDKIDQLEAKDAQQETEIRTLFREGAECKAENRKLRHTIRTLQQVVSNLKAVTSHMTTPVTIPTIMVSTDLDGNICSVSGSVTEVLHYTPDDLLGKNISVLIPEDNRAEYESKLTQAKAGGITPFKHEAVVDALTKGRKRVPVSVTITVWKGRRPDSWYINAEAHPFKKDPDATPPPFKVR